ncbi:fumarylacetoacetate hydrolase family protein [Glaciecola sp. SC05]|uniref:fumarylacetoacetate hydrolase family protein n=1 Tax=Glaciecola sp. SC05 TaxID=1987355 RepID=UPI003527EFD1
MTELYQHLNLQGQAFRGIKSGQFPVGKVVCVGRNYMDHIKELGNEVSELPILFMKPASALVDINQGITLPKHAGECHNELELAFLIGEKLSNASEQECADAIVGVALALDLTLRDLQNQLKKAGQPWERAKAFDGSCPISGFMPIAQFEEPQFEFTLHVNGELRQHGNSQLMLHKVLPLVANISKTFTLMPGDIVLTGTPKGVAALHTGDSIDAELVGHFAIHTQVDQQVSGA